MGNFFKDVAGVLFGGSDSEQRSSANTTATSGSQQAAFNNQDTGAFNQANMWQQVFGPQAEYLSRMWGQASPNLGGRYYDAGANSLAKIGQGSRANLYDPLVRSYQTQFGPASPFSTASNALTQPLISGLTNIMNSPAQVFGAGGNNPLLDKNVALALEQASTNLTRNVLPAIGQNAQAAGQYGGTRQGIAEGLALSDANKQALQTAMGAYGDQYAQDRAASLASQAQQDQTRLNAATQIQQVLGNAAGNVTTGANTGQQLLNLGMGGAQAIGQAGNMQWNPYMNYANLLGAPIVLGNMGSTGASFGNVISGNAGTATSNMNSNQSASGSSSSNNGILGALNPFR
jgi:hypothetical protein